MKYLQVAGKLDNSLVNGPGMRFVLFLSGCKHNCKGCQNKEMQKFDYGDKMSVNEIYNYIKLHSSLIKGITLSGGDPLEQSDSVIELLKLLQPLKLNIWCYTGYLYEDILNGNNNSQKELLKYIDVLIDGKFDQNNVDNALKFTGSKNQRLIYLNNGKLNYIESAL